MRNSIVSRAGLFLTRIADEGVIEIRTVVYLIGGLLALFPTLSAEVHSWGAVGLLVSISEGP